MTPFLQQRLARFVDREAEMRSFCSMLEKDDWHGLVDRKCKENEKIWCFKRVRLEVSQGRGEPTPTAFAAGDLVGTLDGHALDGHTLDVAGPYALFRARLEDDGVEIGRVRGVLAQFHYTTGAGRVVGMARGDDPGGVLGTWSDGAFDVKLVRRAPECE